MMDDLYRDFSCETANKKVIIYYTIRLIKW